MGEISDRLRRLEEQAGFYDADLPPLPTPPPRKDKTKKFSIPFRGKVGKVRARKGYTTVMKIMDNRNIEFEKQQVSDQTVIVDGVPRIVTPEETLLYRGKPFIIVPSWSVKPFSPTDHLEATEKSQLSVKGHKLLLARMLGEVIQAKKKMNIMVVFIIILALIVGGYFLSKGGMFN